MREVAVVNLKSDAATGLRGWLRFRKRLPEVFGPFEKGRSFTDTEWEEGTFYLDAQGRTVLVLDTQDVFMGKSALIQYVNGALRWISYETELWEDVTRDSEEF